MFFLNWLSFYASTSTLTTLMSYQLQQPLSQYKANVTCCTSKERFPICFCSCVCLSCYLLNSCHVVLLSRLKKLVNFLHVAACCCSWNRKIYFRNSTPFTSDSPWFQAAISGHLISLFVVLIFFIPEQLRATSQHLSFIHEWFK